jgi:hypothetical protein
MNLAILGLTYFTRTGENARPSLTPILNGVLITSTIVGVALVTVDFRLDGKVQVLPLEVEVEFDFVHGMENRIPLVVRNISSVPMSISGWRTNHAYAKITPFQRITLAPEEPGTFDLVLQMPAFEKSRQEEVVDGLSDFVSIAAAEAWEKKRLLSFYDPYGDDIATVVIRERIPKAVISTHFK